MQFANSSRVRYDQIRPYCHRLEINGGAIQLDISLPTLYKGLADFDRFVFVLCVLERYRENDRALLLGCSASQVREAWTRAIETLSSIVQVVVPASSDRRYAI
jgi:hypothetical protein